MNKSLKMIVSLVVLSFVVVLGFQNCSQKPLDLNQANLGSGGTSPDPDPNGGGSGAGSGGGTVVSTGLSAAQANYTIDEGKNISVGLSLSSPAAGNYTVSWVIEPIDTGLISTDDFSVVTGSFSILLDQTGGSINIAARENAVVAVDKRYRLRITFSESSQPLILGLTVRDNDAAQVYASHVHACVVKSGALKCFGYNNYGQLGNGNAVNQSLPVAVSGMDINVQKVALGVGTTCAIKAGQLYCWGYNGYGQLGRGTTDAQANAAPALVPTMDTGVTDVALGFYNACAIKGGAVFCWGMGGYGIIGDGAFVQRNSPTPVPALSSGVTAIAVSDMDDVAAGVSHACAIKAGALYCWGWNGYGQLGEGTVTNRGVPMLVSGMEADVTHVAVGGYSTCAVRKDNLYCWGYNGNGQLGLNDTLERRAPIKVDTFVGKRISQIDGGKQHFCATADGKVYCWGYNGYSQIGTGNTVNANLPAQLAGMDVGITSISASSYNSYAIQNNRLISWGMGTYGQLANGTTNGVTAPTMVLDLAAF